MPNAPAPRAKAPAPKQPPAPVGGAKSQTFAQRFMAWLKGKPAVQQELAVKPASAALKPPAPAVDPIRALAEGLVDTAGTAGGQDKQAVVAELIKIPRGGLAALKKKGTRVVVCRGSVTEVMTELKGVRPRGWPPGKTWDIVPGLYDPGKNRVIVATKDGVLPKTGEGHGSANLVIHEVGHAIDAAGGDSGNAEFTAAREKDKGSLTAYELQEGAAGLEESYAEGLARYLSDPAKYKKDFPALHAYWSSNPLDKLGG